MARRIPKKKKTTRKKTIAQKVKKTVAQKTKSFLRAHERNIISERQTMKSKLYAGNIVRFNYKGELATVKRPLAIVLNPDYKGKFHALSLDVIPDNLLVDLLEIIQEAMEIEFEPRARLPLLKVALRDPQRFYNTKIKSFLGNFGTERGETPYRTYKRSGITNIRIIDYKFKTIPTTDIRKKFLKTRTSEKHAKLEGKKALEAKLREARKDLKKARK